MTVPTAVSGELILASHWNALRDRVLSHIDLADAPTDAQVDAGLTRAQVAGKFLPPIIATGSGTGTPLTTNNVPFVGGNQKFKIFQQHDYTNDGLNASNLVFNAAFVAKNEQVSPKTPTVGLFSEGVGEYVWGANILGYGRSSQPGSAPSVIGLEVDFGNLNPTPATILTGISIHVIGGNVNGGLTAEGSMVQFAANDSLSQVPTGLKFSAGQKQPIGEGGTRFHGTLTAGSPVITDVDVTSGYANGDFVVAQGVPSMSYIVSGAGTSSLTLSANATVSGTITDNGGLIISAPGGTLLDATSSIVNVGMTMSAAVFGLAAIAIPVNAGRPGKQSFGLFCEAKGGHANTGCFVEMRSTQAGSTVANGMRFSVIGGNQPVATTGSAINFTTMSSAFGLNMSLATFTTAGIAMGDNNISAGTTTGMKIGTATGQKIGFYNATPISRPSVSAAATDAATTQTLVNSLRTALLNLGLAA